MRGLSGTRSWIAVLFTFVAMLLLGAAACTDTVSGGILPTTGILIRAETLTTGKGCGVGPTQVFKYVIVVYRYTDGDPKNRNSYRTFQASNLFDCYVDGEFVSLPSNVGNNIFRLEVFAFNQASYLASQTAIDSAIRSTNDSDPTNDQASSDPFKSSVPTWTTECTATQSNEVETLAQCDVLSPGLGGIGDGTIKSTQILVATDQFKLPDGRTAVCLPGVITPLVDGGSDAAAEAGNTADAGDAGDAGSDADTLEAGIDSGTDAGSADAGGNTGTTVAFSKVRARARIGSNIVAGPIDFPCLDAQGKAEIVLDIGAEPANYTVDIGLIDATDAPLGETACTATTATGVTNVASCAGR